MKYIYKVEGLDCANCTAKLEKELQKINNVNNLSLSFMNQKLSYETDDDTVYDSILKIIASVEPDVNVIGVNLSDECSCVIEPQETSVKDTKLGSKQLMFEGLTCANCANKIEIKLKKTNGLNNVSYNFMNKTLNYDSALDTNETVNLVQKIVDSIEDGVKVSSLNQEESKPKYDSEVIKIIVASIFYVLGLLFEDYELIAVVFFGVSYLLVGLEVLILAFKNILKGKVFDENFLMAIATLGAILIKDYAEGIAVMLFYQIGEYFQELAVNKSRKSITNLMDIKQDYANLYVNDAIEIVDPKTVKVDDIIVVKPGEIVPLDGIIIAGYSSLNTSALTGESLLQDVKVNDEVLSGVVNTNGVIKIKVTKSFKDGTVNRILDLVENASSRKTKTENFITVFARYYTPIVCALALIIAFVVPLFIEGRPFNEYIYRGLSFLVVSCPCALVISIPLGYFAGIGGLSKLGVLVKGSNYIEALSKIDTVLLDKTGTITEGKFKVSKICGSENLLEICAYGESFSNHPIAQSIVKKYDQSIDQSKIKELKEIQGQGLSCKINGMSTLIGNETLMMNNNIKYTSVNEIGTLVHVSYGNEYLGYILIQDMVKESSEKAISNLKEIGINKIVMLTGDNELVASVIAKEVGISDVKSNLLPDQKVEIAKSYIDQGKNKVAFVGDGVNDAPVLALADVGISMGTLGSDAAIEASDVVLMHDDLNSIVDAIRQSKKTQRLVYENIVLALGIKVVVLLLVSIGLANMWAAVFADVGVAMLAIINSIRALKV